MTRVGGKTWCGNVENRGAEPFRSNLKRQKNVMPESLCWGSRAEKSPYVHKQKHGQKNCILWHSLRKKQRKLQWTLEQTQNTRDMWQLVVCELFSHGLYSHRCSPAEGWKGSVPEAIFVMSHLTNHCKTGWMGKASRLFQYKPMKSFLKKESYNKANC